MGYTGNKEEQEGGLRARARARASPLSNIGINREQNVCTLCVPYVPSAFPQKTF